MVENGTKMAASTSENVEVGKGIGMELAPYGVADYMVQDNEVARGEGVGGEMVMGEFAPSGVADYMVQETEVVQGVGFVERGECGKLPLMG